MLEHMGHRRTVILGLILGLTGLLASSFVSYMHLMYVTFGLFGTGAAMIVNACINIVGMHFSNGNSSRAFAVVSVGIPSGTFALNILEAYIYHVYGWRKSLFIIAGIYLVISAISLISFTPPSSGAWGKEQSKNSIKPEHSKPDLLKYLRIFCHLKFILFELGIVLLGFSISFHYIDFVSVIDKMIHENSSGTVAVSVLSFSDLLALIALACLGNRLPKIRRYILPLVLLILNIPATILFSFEQNVYAVYAAASLSGVARGILLAAPFSLVLEIFGAEHGSECLTHTIMAIGIGSLTGPIALSLISERFTYRFEFITCAISSGVGALLFFMESCLTMNKPVKNEPARFTNKPSSYGAINEERNADHY
ncbi:monocarboxylate transporter 1-like isoform X2 [Antedon mediterranea]